jgi:hypothetical protein
MRRWLSILEQTGLSWVGKLVGMSVVKHIPDTSPEPTGTQWACVPTRVYLPLPYPLEIKAGTPRETRLRLTTSSRALWLELMDQLVIAIQERLGYDCLLRFALLRGCRC